MALPQPGHEYTKANVKFAFSILKEDEPVQKLYKDADKYDVTTGRYTIGDEKVGQPMSTRDCKSRADGKTEAQCVYESRGRLAPPTPKRDACMLMISPLQDPLVQQVTGETEPVSVMAKLREMKNNFK